METSPALPPPNNNMMYCSVCGMESEFVEGGKMLNCIYCRQVVYCSTECQQWHWDHQHKNECEGRQTTVVFVDELPPAPSPPPRTTPAMMMAGKELFDDGMTQSRTSRESSISSTSDGAAPPETTIDTDAAATHAAPPPEGFDPNDDSPVSRLQRIYNQDGGYIDSEFEAYAQAYYAKKAEEREEEKQNKCKGRLSPLILWGLVVQIITILILTFVYVSLEKNQKSEPLVPDDAPPQQAATTTLHPTTSTSGSTSASEMVVLTAPPTDILQFCNPHAISTPAGRETCHKICAPAECCYMSETNPKHCWKSDDDSLKICHEYRKACSVLSPLREYDHPPYHNGTHPPTPAPFEPPTTVYPNALVLWDKPELLPPAPETLLETCQAGFLWDDPWAAPSTSGATLTCHEVCYKASCCWDSRLTNAADRCWTHPHCWAYSAACSFLLRDHHHASTTSSAQEQAMAEDQAAALPSPTKVCDTNRYNSSVANLVHCQEACLPSECCWNSAFVDKCDDQSQCQEEVESCSVLNVPLPVVDIPSPPQQEDTTSEPATATTAETPPTAAPSSSNSSSSSDLNMTNHTYSADTIRDACWNHDNSIQTAGHKTLCEQVCQAGSCCYNNIEDHPGAAGCPDYLPQDFCTKYEPCMVITIGKQQELDLQAQIDTACSNRDDLSECVALCGTGTCCFTNDPWKTCITTQPDTICTTYAACEVLYNVEVEGGGDQGEGGEEEEESEEEDSQQQSSSGPQQARLPVNSNGDNRRQLRRSGTPISEEG